MRVRLIAMDLDGTLTDSRKRISARTVDTLTRAARAGATLALASGRPLIGIRPVARSLGLKELGGCIMAYNGGQIVDCASEKDIYRQNFPPEYIREVVDWAHREGLAILSYDAEGIVTEGPVDQYVRHESENNALPIRVVESLPAYLTYPIVKMLICGEPSHVMRLKGQMAEAFRGRADIYLAEPMFLEVMPLGIDKAAGLRRLMEHLNVAPEEVIACGDAYNDLPMLRQAHASVAMANAIPEVRQVARYVTRSNDEDGVAYAVERLMFSSDPAPERGEL